MKVRVSVGPRVRSTATPVLREFTSEEFLSYLRNHAETRAPGAKLETPYLCGAVFQEGGGRRKEAVNGIVGLALDIEEAEYAEHPLVILPRMGVECFAYTTQSHGVDGKWSPRHPRFRVYVPLPDIDGDPEVIHRALQLWASEWLVGVDTTNAMQAQLVPTRPHTTARAAAWVEHIAGPPLDPDRLPMPDGSVVDIGTLVRRIEKLTKKRAVISDEEREARIAAYNASDSKVRATVCGAARTAIQRAIERVASAPSGERNQTLYRSACVLGNYAHVLSDEDLGHYAQRLREAIAVAMGAELGDDDTDGAISRGVAAGMKRPVDVADYEVHDPNEDAPVVSLKDARERTRGFISGAQVAGGKYVVAVPPSIGKSHAVEDKALDHLLNGAGRPAFVYAGPTHDWVAEKRDGLVRRLEDADIEDTQARRLADRVVVITGRSNDTESPFHCAERETYNALYEADPTSAEDYCRTCAHRAECPFIASRRQYTPEALRGRVVVTTHASLRGWASRLNPGTRRIDWHQVGHVIAQADGARVRPRVRFTDYGGLSLELERAPIGGAQLPQFDEEDIGGGVLTPTGKDTVLLWLCDLKGPRSATCAPTVEAVVEHHARDLEPFSCVVIDEDPYNAFSASHAISRDHLAQITAMTTDTGAESVIALMDQVADAGRSRAELGEDLADIVVTFDPVHISEIESRLRADALRNTDVESRVTALRGIPPRASLEALEAASRDGWRYATIDGDGTLRIDLPPAVWTADIARTTIVLDATTTDTHLRTILGTDIDGVLRLRVPLHEGTRVTRVENLDTSHRGICAHDGRPNRSGRARWGVMHLQIDSGVRRARICPGVMCRGSQPA